MTFSMVPIIGVCGNQPTWIPAIESGMTVKASNIPCGGINIPVSGISNILILGVIGCLIGCTPIVVQPDLPCPAKPILVPISVAEQILINPQVIRKLAENQLALKTYARKLEVRANCTTQ